MTWRLSMSLDPPLTTGTMWSMSMLRAILRWPQYTQVLPCRFISDCFSPFGQDTRLVGRMRRSLERVMSIIWIRASVTHSVTNAVHPTTRLRLSFMTPRGSLLGLCHRPCAVCRTVSRPDSGKYQMPCSGAEGRSRTGTGFNPQRFLRPPRLPFRHFGRQSARLDAANRVPSVSAPIVPIDCGQCHCGDEGQRATDTMRPTPGFPPPRE